MTDDRRASPRLKQVRIWLWIAVAVAVIAGVAVAFSHHDAPATEHVQGHSTLGGPFTLTGADGKPFSSSRLAGKPYAIYFGFTRCGDVCPTTLSRLVKLRQQVGGPDVLSIVFVTIDPTHDGPREVGQYADLFNSPIIGLTGSQQQIDAVKKQFAVYAEPVPDAPAGHSMEHTGTVLLFDRDNKLAGTITTDESDASALETLKRLV